MQKIPTYRQNILLAKTLGLQSTPYSLFISSSFFATLTPVEIHESS